MNHFSKVFVAFLLGLGAVLLSASAMAGTGGRLQGQNVRYMFNTTATLSANVGYTIRATAVGNADPVLHVQYRPSGDFLAGNDDFSGLSPSVTIPSAGTTRQVWIIVRAYSNAA